MFTRRQHTAILPLHYADSTLLSFLALSESPQQHQGLWTAPQDEQKRNEWWKTLLAGLATVTSVLGLDTWSRGKTKRQSTCWTRGEKSRWWLWTVNLQAITTAVGLDKWWRRKDSELVGQQWLLSTYRAKQRKTMLSAGFRTWYTVFTVSRFHFPFLISSFPVPGFTSTQQLSWFSVTSR